MQQIILDAEAGQISAELAWRGVAPDARVHVLVEVSELTAAPFHAARAPASGGLVRRAGKAGRSHEIAIDL